VIFVALLIIAGLGIVVHGLFDTYVMATQRLAEETRLIAGANPDHRIEPGGGAEPQRLASEINVLADRYRLLEAGVEARVAAAHSDLEQERNRLAALMSELAQSVLVCNVEGRILLYNQRALQLLSAPAEAPGERNAAMAVGLGRSLFGVMDRNVVLHALEHIQERFKHGDARPVADFVTALAGGRLIRVQMAPVLAVTADQGARAAAASAGSGARISGYVLTMEDIQRSVENASRRDRLLRSLTEGTRASLANIRAAIETMLAFPDMEPARRQRFEQVIHDEAQGLSHRLDSTITDYADCVRAEWPLETMLARDLIAATQRSIETRLGMSVTVGGDDELVWLAVDSYSLVQALTRLAGRLKHERGVQQVRFHLEPRDRQAHAYLDLIWDGAPLAADTAAQWERTAIDLGNESTPLTFEDIVERHNGQVWHQSDAAAGTAWFRILLPQPDQGSAPIELPTAPSRPDFYDFDLFHQPGQRPELDQCLLSELSYTVFDTETTGLEPSAGDEIISIGAVRIVNGRLIRNEVFDQLIDADRPLSPESIRIHGIQPAMLKGQPRIERVLPRFHRYCEDTVLVAHNAAFDMRFLQLKEAATGARFTQPVLDTLMLSAVVQPNQRVHDLEAIAARLGINVIGRHTALGDAILTGEIFLKLIPLLAAQGVRTLKDARDASQQTPYARVHY
jgi:DNA polymerase-3 subunit epsilon